ncbi:hypothetical protein DL93DRAFT_2125358 [Clavulina sp. PMI_390]|nr:hypothetical protein DL93DRAFT_2125358 [Clavulina sp. PMI_390]
MHSATLLLALLGATFSVALPIRRDVTLDPAATAEAQQRDNTATRALTAVPIKCTSTGPTSVSGAGGTLNPTAAAEANPRDNTATRALSAAQIKTSSGQCLDIDPLSGDFRENLIPIQLKACDGSPNQQWDVITQGVHTNTPGQALIVSTLTNGCLNFDPRRAAGNQVLLFSCGGRADGGGQITNSQQFAFSGVPTSAIALIPANGNNAVCLTGSGALLDQAACNTASPSANELFTFVGGGAPTIVAAVSTTPKASTKSKTKTKTKSKTTTTTSTTTSAPVLVVATTTSSGPTSVSGAGGTLNPTAAAEANPRDNTATRALSAAQIKTSSGQCLDIDPLSGDFRENLIPVQLKACDGSPNQQWDVITQGVHTNTPGQALIVSTLMNGCLNFDPRRAAGNQVLLFSCGGRADGTGQITNSQQFAFSGVPTSAIPLIPANGNNAVCLTGTGSLLDQAACNTASPSADELFTFVGGNGGAVNAATTTTSSSPAATTSSSTAPASTTAAPATTTTASSTTAGGPTSVSGAGGTLNPTAAAEANPRDNTATRAFTAAQIKTSSGECLFIDPLSGDFRENLIPVQSKPCDGSAGQQWDVITAGVHNNVPGQALIVSTLTNGCLNFDPRRAAGNQVLLFSCGGRADGGGQVTNSQLFAFDSTKTTNVALLPQNGNNAVCLTAGSGADLDQTACSGASSATGAELFSFVA